MNPRPSVSFIVTVYNKEYFLPAVFDAMLAQSGDFEREYVIVNDGSTDNSLALIREFAERTPDVVVIDQVADQRLTGGDAEGDTDALGDRPCEQHPEFDHVGQYQHREHRVRRGERPLRDHGDRLARPAIGNHPANRAEHEHWQAKPEEEQPEGGGGVREVERQESARDDAGPERGEVQQYGEPEHPISGYP